MLFLIMGHEGFCPSTVLRVSSIRVWGCEFEVGLVRARGRPDKKKLT